MPVDGVADVMQAHREIQWIVLLRKDLVKQCLSFLYTNKTGDTARTQTEKVSVDTSLVDYFFELHRVIQEVVSRNVFQVVYYEDLDLSHAAYKATGNDYESLITNLDSVKRAIKKHISLN
jgi:hypothetical protein